MRLDKLTEKSREALLEAQHLAEQYTHPAVEPELEGLLVGDRVAGGVRVQPAGTYVEDRPSPGAVAHLDIVSRRSACPAGLRRDIVRRR